MQDPWIKIIELLGSDIANEVKTITHTEFTKFDQEYVFDAVKGQRYGQAFCNRFNITDFILMTTQNVDSCKKYIKNIYIR